MLKGRIIKNISNDYSISSNGYTYICKPRGKFRNTKETPIVGDIVEFDEEKKLIIKIDKRKNELKRPSVSNIDIALIVTSLKNPDLSLNLLDKEISNIILENIEPVICFTKKDLVMSKDLEEIKEIEKYYKKIGIQVFYNDDLNNLKNYMQNKIVVLTGQTGAGKSSLLNKLDEKLDVKIGEISESLNRGKHTTRHTEVYNIDNIFIVDTPGFSSLDLEKYNKEEIRDSFKEFGYNCEYRNCMHDKEENCDVKLRVIKGDILKSRYDNYLNFIK